MLPLAEPGNPMKKRYWIGREQAGGCVPFMLPRTGPATEGERTALQLPLPALPRPRDRRGPAGDGW